MSELNRTIGERMGYRAAVIDTNAMTGQQVWALLAPDGQICADGRALSQNEAGVWEHYSPPYSGDVGLALSLVPPWTPSRVFMLRQCEHGWLAAICDVGLHPDGGACEAVSETPADAICKAWLTWAGEAQQRPPS